jgi:hypothetical protein
MSNCSQDTARLGWANFRSLGDDATLTRINENLLAEGSGPVSDRMFRHYRRLARCGFGQYMPINELDMRMKLRDAG